MATGLPERDLLKLEAAFLTSSRYEWQSSSSEFAELAGWCRDLVDSLATGLPERDLLKLEVAFLTSSRYEWQFWEMAWKMEQWPV